MLADRSGESLGEVSFGHERETVGQIVTDLVPDDAACADTVDRHCISALVHDTFKQLAVLEVGRAFGKGVHPPIILHLGRGGTIASMEIPIRRVDKDLPLPEYKTAGAAAMDCTVREDAICQPGKVTVVHLNIAIKLPRGHFLLMAARGSLQKRGLMMANGIGIGDEDFSGNNDEYRVALYNFSSEPVSVKRGERLVQIMVLPFDRVVWKEVDSLGESNRGGFGTTGI